MAPLHRAQRRLLQEADDALIGPRPRREKESTMTTHQDPSRRLQVLIAGAGVAGLETALALRALAGKRVAITLVAPEHDFVSVAQGYREAFGGEHATRR